MNRTPGTLDMASAVQSSRVKTRADNPGLRRRLVKRLMCFPGYLTLGARQRLALIQKIENGLDLSVAIFQMKVWQWLKTGKLV